MSEGSTHYRSFRRRNTADVELSYSGPHPVSQLAVEVTVGTEIGPSVVVGMAGIRSPVQRKGSRTAWVVSIVPSVRTPWVVGHRRRIGAHNMDALMPELLLSISYEQKSQPLEISDVVKTVLATAI